MDEEERRDVVAFLKALSDWRPEEAVGVYWDRLRWEAACYERGGVPQVRGGWRELVCVVEDEAGEADR